MEFGAHVDAMEIPHVDATGFGAHVDDGSTRSKASLI
jgi:hypothetical protein